MARFVQSAVSPNNGSYLQNFSVATTSAVASGNTLIAFIEGGDSGAHFTSVTDNIGNTWTMLSSSFNGIGTQVWYAKNVGAGVTTVTANGDGGYYIGNISVREYSGATTVSLSAKVDESAYLNSHALSATVPTGGLLMVAYGANPQTTYTAGSGATNVAQGVNGSYASQATADSSTGTTTINSAAYVEGTVYGILLSTPPPLTPPPGPINTPNWYPYGVLPTGKTVAQLQGYAVSWWDNHVKNYIVTTGMPSGLTGAMRVQRPENSNDTVSEGMGYGLIAAVMMDPYDTTAHSIFDGLYTYVKHYLNSNGLMNYRLNSDGTVYSSGGAGAATDADYDIAWALDKASERWGNAGTFNYATEATSYKNAMLATEFYPAAYGTTSLRNVQINGDSWDSGFTGSPDWYMADYNAPMYNQKWGGRWLDIKAANYPIYNKADLAYGKGFVPDQQTRAGEAVSGQTYVYGYNSIRRFRQVIDYLNNGSSLANYEDYYVHKHMADFIATQSSSTPANMKAEWAIDGTSSGTYINDGFSGSYMVSMLVNGDHAQLAADTIDYMIAHPDGAYFGDMLTQMNLMTAAGMMTPTVSAATTPVVNSGQFFAFF